MLISMEECIFFIAMHKFLALKSPSRINGFILGYVVKSSISNRRFVLMLFSVDLTGCSVLINRLLIIPLYLQRFKNVKMRKAGSKGEQELVF